MLDTFLDEGKQECLLKGFELAGYTGLATSLLNTVRIVKHELIKTCERN